MEENRMFEPGIALLVAIEQLQAPGGIVAQCLGVAVGQFQGFCELSAGLESGDGFQEKDIDQIRQVLGRCRQCEIVEFDGVAHSAQRRIHLHQTIFRPQPATPLR